MIAVVLLLGSSLILLAGAMVMRDLHHDRRFRTLSALVVAEAIERKALSEDMRKVQRAVDGNLDITAPIDVEPLPPPPPYAGAIPE